MAVISSGGHTLLSSSRIHDLFKSPNPDFQRNLAFPVQTHFNASSLKLVICSADKLAGKRCVLRHVSSEQQPPITSIEDEEGNSNSSAPSEDERKLDSNLKSVLNAYKEAVLCEDEKSMAQIETKMNAERDDVIQKLSSLTAEVNSGKEKYIRLQADFDNFRKRAEKDRINIRSNTQGEVVETFLVMVDSFERAKQQLVLETEREKKIDSSYQGIYKQFVEIMRSLKVAAVPTIGKPFDPSIHEAISREESYEYKEGIIVQEFRRGFLLEGRLLRPAMVKVSAGPGRQQGLSNAETNTVQSATTAGVEGQ